MLFQKQFYFKCFIESAVHKSVYECYDKIAVDTTIFAQFHSKGISFSSRHPKVCNKKIYQEFHEWIDNSVPRVTGIT